MKWAFARRYLISRSSHSVINIIAAVSLISVAIPVAAMVILLSVFNGFESLVKDMYADVDADIEIRASHSAAQPIMLPSDENRASLLNIEGVEALSFIIEQQVLAQYEGRQCIVNLRGADDGYLEVLPIHSTLISGKPRLTLGEIDYLLLGQDAAQALGLYSTADHRITLRTLGGGEIGSMLPLRNLRQCQIWLGGKMRATQIASLSGVVPLRAAQSLFGLEEASAILIRTTEDANPNDVRDRLAERLGKGVEVKCREEKNALFYQIMKYEKWAVFFVSLLVLIIASLSIIGTVIMLIVEKRDEQPTLLAMGADMAFIRGIFIREGLLISGIGGVAGILLGVGVVLAQHHLHIVKMPSGEFITDSYPVELHSADLILIFISFLAVAWSVSRIATGTMIKPKKLCNDD